MTPPFPPSVSVMNRANASGALAALCVSDCAYPTQGSGVDRAPEPATAAAAANEIHVQGQRYTVFLNGIQVSQFENTDPGRGLAATPATPSYFGFQTHTGRVAFRNIRIHALAVGETPPTPAVAAAAAVPV
jgi:3-keto-disaccharide hydrolase